MIICTNRKINFKIIVVLLLSTISFAKNNVPVDKVTTQANLPIDYKVGGEFDNFISSDRPYSTNLKDYTPDDEWYSKKQIPKTLNRESKSSIKEKDNKLKSVNNSKAPIGFNAEAQIIGNGRYLMKVTGHYSKDLYKPVYEEKCDEVYDDFFKEYRKVNCHDELVRYEYDRTVTRTIPYAPVDGGKIVGVTNHSSHTPNKLISDKLEKRFLSEMQKYNSLTQSIKTEMEKNFNQFRYANGRTSDGENKDKLDPPYRNANTKYALSSKEEDKDNPLFKTYSNDKDDFYDVKKDDASYNARLKGIERIKGMLIDENNSFKDLEKNARNQIYLRKILEYERYLLTKEEQTKKTLTQNQYFKDFLSSDVRSMENTLNRLLAFRGEQLEKLNRALNNGNKRASLVQNASNLLNEYTKYIDNDEDSVGTNFNNKALPQLKRIYQTIAVITNQSRNALNQIAQAESSEAIYNEIDTLVLLKSSNDMIQAISQDVYNKTRIKEHTNSFNEFVTKTLPNIRDKVQGK